MVSFDWWLLRKLDWVRQSSRYGLVPPPLGLIIHDFLVFLWSTDGGSVGGGLDFFVEVFSGMLDVVMALKFENLVGSLSSRWYDRPLSIGLDPRGPAAIGLLVHFGFEFENSDGGPYFL